MTQFKASSGMSKRLIVLFPGGQDWKEKTSDAVKGSKTVKTIVTVVKYLLIKGHIL